MDKKKLLNKELYAKYNVGQLSESDKQKILKFLPFFTDKKVKTLVDVGCNPLMTVFIAEKLTAVPNGVNIVPDGFPKKGKWICKDVEKGVPFESNEFDMVFCGEVIEHVVDADFLLSEMKRVLRKNGYLVLTTPNLSSLFNRFFILFGLQPHLFGVSNKKAYGNPFLKYDKFCGHLKLFTYKALREFLEDNGFEIKKAFGWNIHNPTDSNLKKSIRGFLSKFPSLSEDVIVICQKK